MASLFMDRASVHHFADNLKRIVFSINRKSNSNQLNPLNFLNQLKGLKVDWVALKVAKTLIISISTLFMS